VPSGARAIHFEHLGNSLSHPRAGGLGVGLSSTTSPGLGPSRARLPSGLSFSPLRELVVAVDDATIIFRAREHGAVLFMHA
jgi:hypothetical protein